MTSIDRDSKRAAEGNNKTKQGEIMQVALPTVVMNRAQSSCSSLNVCQINNMAC